MFASECSPSLLSVAVLYLVSLVGSQAGPVPSVCPVMSAGQTVFSLLPVVLRSSQSDRTGETGAELWTVGVSSVSVE